MTVEALDVQFSVAECETVCMSVPDAAIVGELGALLTGESVAATLPVVVGVNFTVNALDWPAATVSGKFNPVRAKPAPVIVACDTLRLALPGLLRITV